MTTYYNKLAIPNWEEMAHEINIAISQIHPKYREALAQNISTFTNLVVNYENTSIKQILKTYKRFMSLCPKFSEWLNAHGVSYRDIFSMSLVIVAGNSASLIHVDPSSEKFPSYKYGEALNFPIHNCDAAYTAWFQSITKLPLSEQLLAEIQSSEYATKNGMSHQEITKNAYMSGHIYDPTTSIEIARVKLTTPIYCRIDIPHQAINMATESRAVLSIRLTKEIAALGVSYSD